MGEIASEASEFVWMNSSTCVRFWTILGVGPFMDLPPFKPQNLSNTLKSP